VTTDRSDRSSTGPPEPGDRELGWTAIAERANGTRPTVRLVRAVRRHVDLLSNSGSLMASTLVTSALGFGYWWVAARAFSPEAVGTASAAVSAMTVIGTLGMFGMGTLLISELPRTTPERRWSLISACLLVAGCAATVGGLAYVAVARFAVTALRGTVESPVWAGLLVVGVAASAMAMVLDEGLIGLLAGRLQLIRNAYFAVAKLVILGVLALLPVAVTGGEVLATWVAGLLLSVLPLAVSLRRHGLLPSVRPDLSALRGLGRLAHGHNLLNIAVFLPRTTLPLVVTAVLSTRATAGFYTAWMIFAFLAMVPGALATTLFAVAAGASATLRSKVRMALFVSLATGLPVSILLALLAGQVLAIFGAGYAATASGSLTILALTYVPTVFRQLYIAVARIRGFVRTASYLAVLGGAAELAAAWYGGSRGDLTTLTAGFAVVVAVEGLVMAPVVLRAALARSAPAERARAGRTGPVRERDLTQEVTLTQPGGAW
jgi:O-antigen/teichoic acid export membrane protein